jgi:glycosyltransferase involved in cell wall biosynthesis
MRVLLATDQAAPVGGAEIMTYTLREALRRRGHDARIFAADLDGLGAASFADYTCVGTTSPFRTVLQAYNPWARARLRGILSEFQPDVVHVRIFLTQLSPSILPLLRNRRCLYHAVWPRIVCPLGTKTLPDGSPCRRPAGAVCYTQGCLPLRDWPPHMVQRGLLRRWRGVFGAIVANSDACRRQLLADGVGPVDVIWNGVPICPPRPPLEHPPEIACAARLVRQKGVDVLLRAFARVRREVPDARLVVFGDGPERTALERLGSELGVASAIAWLGHVSPSGLEDRIRGSWVQALPSRWTESFGLAAAEAMMRGTAVVASELGGLPEFVEHGRTGLLVPPEDDAALAAALTRLLVRREEAERMGAAARQFAVDALSDDLCAAKFIERYERLAA